MKTESVNIDGFGDLRILRNSLMHDRKGLTAKDHEKLKVTQDLFHPEQIINLDAEIIGIITHRIWRTVLFFAIEKLDIKVNLDNFSNILFNEGHNPQIIHETD